MSDQKRKNREISADGRQKRGLFTSMYGAGKSPQKFLESSNEPMPNAFPYIQAAQSHHIILDQNHLRRTFQNQHDVYQKQANVYLDPQYHAKGLNTAAFGLLNSNSENKNESSFKILNHTAGQMANHISSKPVFFEGSINENTPINTFQHRNHPQFIAQSHAVNFNPPHNIPVYFHGKNVRGVNFGGNFHNSSFESHNPPLKTTVPAQFLDGNIHTVIDGNIKKSYIPQHIYNEIPIYEPVDYNYNYNQNEYEERPGEQNNEQTEQIMLKAYQQLFQKYNQQKGKNSALDRRVIDLQTHISRLQIELNTRQKQNHSNQPKIRRRKKTLDKKVLQQILKLKMQYCVGEVINRRKNNALNRLRDLFSSSYSSMSTFQQHTQTKYVRQR